MTTVDLGGGVAREKKNIKFPSGGQLRAGVLAEFPSCCRSLRKTSERRSTVPRSPSALSVIRIHRGSSLRRNRAGASVLRRCDEGARARPSWSIAPPLCHAFAHHLVASRLGPLSLLSRPLSPRTQPRISHACPLCSQTRPLITPSHAPSFALPPRMRAPVPSLLSDTPSHYALSLRPLTLSFALFHHACMPSHARSYALSPRMHARVPSPLLSGTPSQHYALSRSPFAPSHHACMPSHALLRPALTSHACPLTRSHLACMPSPVRLVWLYACPFTPSHRSHYPHA